MYFQTLFFSLTQTLQPKKKNINLFGVASININTTSTICYKLVKGLQYKATPVDFSVVVAGGWADGGWCVESEKDWKIHTLGPYVRDTCTFCTFMKYLQIYTDHISESSKNFPAFFFKKTLPFCLLWTPFHSQYHMNTPTRQ